MVIETREITKKFFGNKALDSVSIVFREGEIHGLVGENGAGKSTLIKIIGGNYKSDGGDIAINGKVVALRSPRDAAKNAISIVHQEYNLVKDMTVLENIVLGREPLDKFGRVDWKRARNEIEELAKSVHIKVDLDQFAGDLGSAESKVVEILKAYAAKMRVLILDEPTAALPDDDVLILFNLISALKTKAITIIYISHRLDEIFQICDVVSVLKDGKHIGTYPIGSIDHDFLIRSMIGRELREVFPKKTARKSDKIVVSVKNLGDGRKLKNVSFDLHYGEILGIGGMSGQGQRELIRALFGSHQTREGSIWLDGGKAVLANPKQAIKHGIAFLSDDRRGEGLALTQSILSNVSYPSLNLRSMLGFTDVKKERSIVLEQMKALGVKSVSLRQDVRSLSGGNQQRLVLAKWLPLAPRIILFHEPTLGVDIGAKFEIYRLLRKYTDSGISIIMVTSDMLELLNMSDRICVFYEGRVQAIFDSQDATEEKVMAAASGKSYPEGGLPQ